MEKQSISLITKYLESSCSQNNIVTKFIPKDKIRSAVWPLSYFIKILSLRQKFYALFGKPVGKSMWFLESDLDVIKDADGIFVVGVKAKQPLGYNCGLCGYATCAEYRISSSKKGRCMYQIQKLGEIAGKVSAILADYRIDNRIMYSIGETIRKRYMKDIDMVMAFGLSISGKNIFFDRHLSYFIEKAGVRKTTVDKILNEKGIITWHIQ